MRGEFDLRYFFGNVFFLVILLNGLFITGQAQDLFINEVQSSNVSTLYDHTGDTPDWIEFFNGGSSPTNLENYGLSDVDSLPFKWVFPSVILAPDSHLLVYASGLDLKEPNLHWETIVDIGDEWRYRVPQVEPSNLWKNNDFNDSDWSIGKSGFGYGDGDDSTVLESTMSVFVRKYFTITDKKNIRKAYLHIDFDDAFVAYINGIEVARSNIGLPGVIPPFNAPADNYNHEAAIYSGGFPDEFFINGVSDHLVDGENTLAIQVHNHSLTSSDLSAIPIFTIGHEVPPSHQISTSPYINFVPVGLHANFKISSSGESLKLSDPSGYKIDSLFTNNIPANISLGRKPDGSNEWKYFEMPTPALPNVSEGFSSTPTSIVQFSVEAGFYQTGISLELSTLNPFDSIFYTLDGSKPTKEGFLYSKEISIDKAAIVRARVIINGHLPGEITSNSYLINASHDLPVVFVSTDPSNLWDYEEGIYVKGLNAEYDFPYKGANFWQDWERPANVTMYEADGTLAFQIEAGIKIFGAYSRGQDQKSLSIHCRKSYGTQSINYKIFEDRDIEEFKTIILRNSGNDFNNTMLRDAFAGEVVSSLGLDQQAYRPAVVYLNGEYWGIHNIREKINEEFLAAHHQIREEDIDILEGDGQVVRGNAEHYLSLLDYLNSHSLSTSENYEYVKTQIDIENFIKYQIAQIFIDNRDWPGNNIKYWREQKPYSKWKWILFDLDFAFNTWSSDNQFFNTLDYALEPNGPGWPNPPWGTFFLRKLMENESFKFDFINCFADNLNTIFEPTVLEGQLDLMRGGIKNEIQNHLDRWDGSYDYWQERIGAIESFARDRRGYVRSHIKSKFGLKGMYDLDIDVEGEGYIKINTIELKEFPWTGSYYIDVPVKLCATPSSGFKFVEWQGIDTTEKENLSVNASIDTEITAVFEPVDVQEVDIVINEINYNAGEESNSGDWVELLNANNYAVNVSGWKLKDDNENHEYIIPEGSIIDSHGFLVICYNSDDFLTIYPTSNIINKELEFGFSNEGECIKLFSLDDTLMDEVCYENNAPWPTEPNGEGASLSLVNALSNNAHPANWKASIGSGTPGIKNDIITDLEDHLPITKSLLIIVFPNPVERACSVQINSSEDDIISVSLFDISGKKRSVLKYYNLVKGQNLIGLDLEEFSPNISSGVYIMSFKSNAIQEHLRIIIK